MDNVTNDLLLEHLKAIRADITTLKQDVREIRSKQNDIILQIAALRRDQAADAQTVAVMEVRVDQLGERVERIERRLELTDGGSTG